MKYQQGMSLIEIIVFIIVIGILGTTTAMVFKNVLLSSNNPGYDLTASQLARARMALILLNRKVNGFTNMVDPCNSGSLAACTQLSTFATAGGYQITSSISAISNGVRTATVTVTGSGHATSVMRFVQ